MEGLEFEAEQWKRFGTEIEQQLMNVTEEQQPMWHELADWWMENVAESQRKYFERQMSEEVVSL